MGRAFFVEVTDERTARDLEAGGVYIPDAVVDLDEECRVVLRAGSRETTVTARAVMISEDGAGFEIHLTGEVRNQIAALVEISKHTDLERKTTITGTLAATQEGRRVPASSVAPATRVGSGQRVAQGSISPLTAFAPTQQDNKLEENARTARRAAARDPDEDD
jgi:hypothetical protein